MDPAQKNPVSDQSGYSFSQLTELIKNEIGKLNGRTESGLDNAVQTPENTNIRPTGIPELDRILHGGLPLDATVLLAGASGTGKTTLSMQWLFAGYDKYNEPGVYISFTEPVNKIIRNAYKFDFCKKENITIGRIHVEDMRTIMHNLEIPDKNMTVADIDKLIDEISKIMLQCGAKRLVIDSISAIAYRLSDKDLIRTFVYHLDALLAEAGINVLLTSEVPGEGFSVFGVEEFISDGIIKLEINKSKTGYVRTLSVAKMRGINFDQYPVSYRITSNGFKLFPLTKRNLSYPVSNLRLSTGTQGLDNMTSGGFIQGSTILLTGSSGSGKSLISLQYLMANLKKDKKAMLVSFEESRDQILRNAGAFNWNLLDYEKKGIFKMLVAYPEQFYFEELIDSIIKEVNLHQTECIVIDSLSSLSNIYSDELLREFVSRLNSFLKQKLVTTVFTNATSTLLGGTGITDSHISTITDHIIMLRYVEIQSELKHAILIVKMRGSHHDKKLREVSFTSEGPQVTGEFSGFEGILTGSTRQVSESIESQLHALFLESLGPMGEKIFREEKEKGLDFNRTEKLLNELGDQGIVSKRRKEDFIYKLSFIFGKNHTTGGENK